MVQGPFFYVHLFFVFYEKRQSGKALYVFYKIKAIAVCQQSKNHCSQSP